MRVIEQTIDTQVTALEFEREKLRTCEREEHHYWTQRVAAGTEVLAALTRYRNAIDAARRPGVPKPSPGHDPWASGRPQGSLL